MVSKRFWVLNLRFTSTRFWVLNLRFTSIRFWVLNLRFALKRASLFLGYISNTRIHVPVVGPQQWLGGLPV